MKLACDKKYIGLEDVDSQLDIVGNLIILHSDYFKWDRDYIERNPYELYCRYDEQGALVWAMLDVLENAQKMLEMVQENLRAVAV